MPGTQILLTSLPVSLSGHPLSFDLACDCGKHSSTYFPKGAKLPGYLHFHRWSPFLSDPRISGTRTDTWFPLSDHSTSERVSAWKVKGKGFHNVFKKLWRCSHSEKDILPHLAECLKLGFLFQKCLWFIRITIKILMLHVQTVMILPSRGFNIQLSCVFSVANTVLEAKKDKSTDIWFHTRHLVSLC